jgi:Domain of unknown function (DUF4123)
MSGQDPEMVLNELWSMIDKRGGSTQLYAVLDGARRASIHSAIQKSGFQFECLYRGELDPDLAEAAPYLVRLEPDMPFTHWLISKGWGDSWGIFLVAAASLKDVRQHLRKFLMVYDADAKPLYFRYYDPRVLRVYLPTCNAEELRTFFGPVQSYMLEDEDSRTLLRFTAASESLQQQKLPVARRERGASGEA